MKNPTDNISQREQSPVPRRPIFRLARVLGLSDAVFIGTGALLGGGIFTLTGLALGFAGPSLILVIGLNGIIAIMTALAYAELGSTFPQTGGAYIFVKKGLGDFWGHMTGWVSWFANSVACGLYAVSFGFYVLAVIYFLILPIFGVNSFFSEGSFYQKLIAGLIILALGYVNYKGASQTGKVGKIIVYFEILVLLTFGIFGLLWFFKKPDLTASFSPFLPGGIFGLMSAMAILYIGFEGTEIIVQSTEEIKNPKKNIPRAIFISLGVIILLYFLTIFVVLTSPVAVGLSWQQLSGAGQGALIESAKIFIPHLSWIMILGGLFAAAAALNATVFASSHVSFSMARSGSLPRALSKIHFKNRTPYIAIICSTLLVLLLAIFLPLKDIASVTNLLFIFIFMQLHIALIFLRKKMPEVPRPFKVPFYPLPQFIALAAYILLLWQFFKISPVGVGISIFWLLVGVVVFYAYAEPRKIEKIEKEIIFEETVRVEEKKNYRILLPIFHEHPRWKEKLDFALGITKARGGELYILTIKTVPYPLPLKIAKEIIEKEREFLNEIIEISREYSVNAKVFLMAARQRFQAIQDLIKKEKCDLLILSYKGYTHTKGTILGGTMDKVLRQAKCNLIVARIRSSHDLKNILVSSKGGVQGHFIGEVVADLFKGFQSKVNLLYVATPKEVKDGKADKKIENITAKTAILDIIPFQKEIIPAHSSSSQAIAQEIVQRGEDFGTILMAASQGGIFEETILGNVSSIVLRNSPGSVIFVKSHRGIAKPSFLE